MAKKKQEVYTDLEKKNAIPDEFMHDWIFHYNVYNKQWAAIPKESYSEYWNDYKNSSVLRSKHLNTLISLLYKAKGDVNIIEDITGGEIK